MSLELKAKSSSFLPQLFCNAMLFWIASCLANTCAVLFCWSNELKILFSMFQPICGFVSLWVLKKWLNVIAERRQRVWSSSGVSLTSEEIHSFAYLLPTVANMLIPSLWGIVRREMLWHQKTETTLCFEIGMHFIYTMIITSKSFPFLRCT